MRNVKYTISFLSNDQKLLQFVEEKRRTQNFSAYIRNLIRNDMESSENPDFEYIYKYVVRRIKEDGYMIDGNLSNQVVDLIDEADKEVILDLF